MKKLFLILIIPFLSFGKFQNSDLKITVEKFYYENPFSGAFILEDSNASYLISVSVQSSSSNISTMNRIAQVKARRDAMILVNGAEITSEQILKTEEKIVNNKVTYYETYFDEITESGSGFVQGMKFLTSFYSNDKSQYIYIIFKKL